MDAAEYKHVCLSLLFLKYISDAFEEHHARLVADKAQGADPEDPDEYRANSIFWVPPEARWQHLKAQARQATIGHLVDDAMAGIDRDTFSRCKDLLRQPPRQAESRAHLRELLSVAAGGVVFTTIHKFFPEAKGDRHPTLSTRHATLRIIAQELVQAVRANIKIDWIDWTVRDDMRAEMRVLVKRILKRHGYPPDKQEKATQTVLEQAALLSAAWAAA